MSNENYMILAPPDKQSQIKTKIPLQVASGVTPSDRAKESSNNRISYLNNVVNIY